MKRNLLVASCLFLAIAGAAFAQKLQRIVDSRDFFNDPEWQKQFAASYGVNADTEPRLGPIEAEFFKTRLQPFLARTDQEPDYQGALRVIEVDSIERTPSGKQLDFVSEFQETDRDFLQGGT